MMRLLSHPLLGLLSFQVKMFQIQLNHPQVAPRFRVHLPTAQMESNAILLMLVQVLIRKTFLVVAVSVKLRAFLLVALYESQVVSEEGVALVYSVMLIN